MLHEYVLMDVSRWEVLHSSDSLNDIEMECSNTIENDELSADDLAVFKLSHTVAVKVEVTLNAVTPKGRRK